MNDKYLDFVNSPVGARLVRTFGLPQPAVLERERDAATGVGAATLHGSAVIGAAPGAQLLAALAATLAAMQVPSVAHADALPWLSIANQHGLMTGRFEPAQNARERAKALIFDASGIVDSSQFDALYRFFHDMARSIAQSGRVLVLGRAPEQCASVRAATAQRALEGLVRSLGKELRRGVAAQLIYVDAGAEDAIESTLRFFLSPRSAYVSGQVVRLSAAAGGAAAGALEPIDAARPLAGTRALVTGAARGIGAAIAQVLARDGAHVIGLDVEPAADALRATLEPLGGTALLADIGTPEAAAHIAAALASGGGVDIVVHNAGITRDRTIAKMSEACWHAVIDINLSAQERIDDALLDRGVLREHGRIICVSSISGIAGNLGQTNYATSKAGIIGRVHAMAPLLRARSITINAVAPGFIETQMTAQVPLLIREAGRRMNSMSQGGLPIDVAETIAWFAHPGSASVTGNVIRVCGQSLLGA